jgi:DNA-binding MarR family transcriptional regulator
LYDREVIVSLTEDGERLFKELFPKVTSFVRGYADEALGEKELETLHGLLVRLGVTPRL